MARKRSISPRFYANESLSDIDPLGRILFTGLWCFADRNGRMEYRPKRIKAEVLPYDGTVEDVIRWLDDLACRDFIRFYEVAGQRYIQVVNFLKYQSPHPEEKPLHPDSNNNHLPASCEKAGGSLLESECKITDKRQEGCEQHSSSSQVASKALPDAELSDRSAKISDRTTGTRLRAVTATVLESSESNSNLSATCQQLASKLEESYQQSFNSNYNFNSSNSESGPLRARARGETNLDNFQTPIDAFDHGSDAPKPNLSPVEAALCAAVGWLPDLISARQYRVLRQSGRQIAGHGDATPERIARAPDFYRAQQKWSFAPDWIASDWAQISAWIAAQDDHQIEKGQVGNGKQSRTDIYASYAEMWNGSGSESDAADSGEESSALRLTTT
jgi:hypothetical protein